MTQDSARCCHTNSREGQQDSGKLRTVTSTAQNACATCSTASRNTKPPAPCKTGQLMLLARRYQDSPAGAPHCIICPHGLLSQQPPQCPLLTRPNLSSRAAACPEPVYPAQHRLSWTPCTRPRASPGYRRLSGSSS